MSHRYVLIHIAGIPAANRVNGERGPVDADLLHPPAIVQHEVVGIHRRPWLGSVGDESAAKALIAVGTVPAIGVGDDRFEPEQVHVPLIADSKGADAVKASADRSPVGDADEPLRTEADFLTAGTNVDRFAIDVGDPRLDEQVLKVTPIDVRRERRQFAAIPVGELTLGENPERVLIPDVHIGSGAK